VSERFSPPSVLVDQWALACHECNLYSSVWILCICKCIVQREEQSKRDGERAKSAEEDARICLWKINAPAGSPPRPSPLCPTSPITQHPPFPSPSSLEHRTRQGTDLQHSFGPTTARHVVTGTHSVLHAWFHFGYGFGFRRWKSGSTRREYNLSCAAWEIRLQ